jgi:hypothetical protein
VANPNPWKARLKRWERLWPLPIAELEAQAFSVLMLAYEGIAVDDAEQRRKAIHVYFTALAAFTKLQDSVEYECRLRALETLAATNGHADLSRN